MPGFEIIDKKEKRAVEKIFEEGAILFAHGFDSIRKKFHVRDFEKKFCKKFKCKYALSVTSGTAAIKVALKSLGVRPGDEVITQGFNFVATVEAILDIGAKPIITNVDDTLNMDLKDVETLITPKTKVILPVHMLGVAAEIYKINRLAKKKKLKVLEDNCESAGAKFNDKYLGTIGDVGALSFDFGKVITTGEGGMILSNDKKINRYAREYHDHGHENNPRFSRGKDTKKIYGFNYRMTEIQGAIGKVQLDKLNSIIINNKQRYKILLNAIGKQYKMRKIPLGCEPIYDTFVFFEKDKNLRKKILNILKDQNFGTKNLPDALEWHCATYWDHALPKNQLKRIRKTQDLLKSAIAIPIWLRKSIKDYSILGKSLKKLK